MPGLEKPVFADPPPELVDEWANLRAKNLAFQPNVNPHAKPLADKTAELLIFYEDRPGDQSYIAIGKEYKVPVSQRHRVRWPIELYKLFKRLGGKKYVAIAQPTLGDIEKALPEKLHPQFIHEERTGRRELQEPVKVQV